MNVYRSREKVPTVVVTCHTEQRQPPGRAVSLLGAHDRRARLAPDGAAFVEDTLRASAPRVAAMVVAVWESSSFTRDQPARP